MKRLPFIVTLLALALARPVFAAPAQGSLIRTISNSAVYYVADDGKRHAFPDQGTYFSWYQDFSGVRYVSASELATLQLGKNMTRRPGAKLVKIQTDPKVYVVDTPAVLRWVKDEATARALYGANWSLNVADIPDPFFIDYSIGADADLNYDRAARSAAAIQDVELRGLGGGFGTGGTGAAGLLMVRGLQPPTPRSAVLGGTNAELSGLVVSAPKNADVTVTSMTVHAFVDVAEGDEDFQIGTDMDGAFSMSASALVHQVSLYDDAGMRIAGPVTLLSNGGAAFSGFRLPILAGGSKTLLVRGDVSRDVDLGANPDRISFDLVDAATDITSVVTSSGAIATASGTLPNGGAHPPFPVTIRRSGKAIFDWTGTTTYGIAGHAVDIGLLKVSATNDDFTLKTLSFVLHGPLASIDDVRLVSESGATIASVTGIGATFDGLALYVPRGKVAQYRLVADLKTQAQGALRSDIIHAEFANTVPLLFVSATSGDNYRENALGTDAASFTSRMSEVMVRYTQLSARVLPDSPQNSATRGIEAEVLRFGLSAAKDDAVKVRTLTFRIRPSDVNQLGPSNDLLEKWADTVGTNQADPIVTLRSSADGYASAIGEGDSIAITYAIADRNDVRDATPKGRETQPLDSGLITYTFPEGSEPVILAGQEVSFRLYLDTSAFSLGAKTLSVQLLGGNDMQWVDGLTGSPATMIDGTTVQGAPTSPNALYVP